MGWLAELRSQWLGRRAARALKTKLAAYVRQNSRLEAGFEAIGTDIFVAPLEVLSRQSTTWTSWAEGVPALIPSADVVVLVEKKHRSLWRRWSDIETVCGRFVQQPGYEPARFSPPEWPTEEFWRRLSQDFEHPEGFPDDVRFPETPRRRKRSATRNR